MASKLLFVPEGDMNVPGDFSGVPHFFAKALVDQCGRLPVELHVLEHVDCLGVEDILRLRYGRVATTRFDHVTVGKLGRWRNRSLVNTLLQAE